MQTIITSGARASITRLVDRLEGKGLVRRTHSQEDRRRVDCMITAEGSELLEGLDGPVDEADRRLMNGFTKADLETLAGLLDRVAPDV